MLLNTVTEPTAQLQAQLAKEVMDWFEARGESGYVPGAQLLEELKPTILEFFAAHFVRVAGHSLGNARIWRHGAGRSFEFTCYQWPVLSLYCPLPERLG